MLVIDMNADKPKACNCCPCYDATFGHCAIGSQGVPNRYGYDASKVPEWCPIICDVDDIKAEIQDHANRKSCASVLIQNTCIDCLQVIDKYAKEKRND